MNVLGLFCEDIREEKRGMTTLVGILPDNLDLPEIPAVLPKLCFVVRIYLERGEKVNLIRIVLKSPDGDELELGKLEPELIERARMNSERDGNPMAGLIFSAMAGIFEVKKEGRLTIIVYIDEKPVVAGSLNMRALKKA